jgi:hypothetical protein
MPFPPPCTSRAPAMLDSLSCHTHVLPKRCAANDAGGNARMITDDLVTGIVSTGQPITMETADIRDNDGVASELLPAVRRLLDQGAGAQSRREGEAVLSILEPMGLPDEVLAGAVLYPAIRAGEIDLKVIENRDLCGLSSVVSGIAQLDRFELPAEWTPGEALAVQQSEALRKMLLAVVSDVRLVLVRIAEPAISPPRSEAPGSRGSQPPRHLADQVGAGRPGRCAICSRTTTSASPSC